MFSTLKNITKKTPSVSTGAVVGRLLQHPDKTGKIKQGGMRTKGKYKSSDVEGSPLVTIVTVCWNSGKTIEQTILSVFEQSYENIEYIIVDGGSTDNTLEIVTKHQEAIDYYVSEPDDGLYYAMNKGLEYATGEHVLFLNSDDWYELDTVEKLCKALLINEKDFSSALARRVKGDGTYVDILQPMPYDHTLRFGMSLRHELMFIPAKIYNAVGNYNTDYRIISDFEFAIRLFIAGYRVYEIQRPLLNFRLTGVSNTNWDGLIEEHYQLLFWQFAHVKEKTLRELADPRNFSAEVIDKAVKENKDQAAFVEAIIAYGYRRGLYNAKIKPAYKPPADILVSVIVPMYNGEKTISNCLASICNQSLKEIEILCVNDASRDHSKQLVESMLEKDARIQLINNKANRGVSFSRNTALNQAKGRYIYFVDADDELLPEALTQLVAVAEEQFSDMVKGSFEKKLEDGDVHIAGKPDDNKAILSTTFRKTPELLRNTEGFWSYLYRTSFIFNTRFSDKLKMGEDSLFLISLLVRANRIAWLPTVVYRYHINSNSAMNNFDFYKYSNSIEWRERAWRVFHDFGYEKLANWCAFEYWNPVYFTDMENLLDSNEITQIKERLYRYLRNTEYVPCENNNFSINQFDPLLQSTMVEKQVPYKFKKKLKFRPVAIEDLKGDHKELTPLQIGVFSTMDKGGAATGSIRRVEALRAEGFNVTLHALITEKNKNYIRPLIPKEAQKTAWENLKRIAIDPVMQNPGYKGSELFSMPRSVVDYTKYQRLINSLGIIHLHWVVGVLDNMNFGKVVGDKGVAWTLADMAAFTGGCHYSEGCYEFERECKTCHLLPEGSKIAHENWKIKRKAYSSIKNLEIICPSEWMAKLVSKSSLLGGRKVNVIPNAMPVNDFIPVNRMVSRIKLGLPLNKTLILFGADSVANKRKGGDILKEALQRIAKKDIMQNVEIMTYGHHSLDLPYKVHSLGFIKDVSQLSMAYSAANIYAFPSREDNAPLTVAESLLCGVPVVSFPVGNVPELVTHGQTGYLAEYLDIEDFSRGIEWAVAKFSGDLNFDSILNCRMSAVKHHDPKFAVKRHLDVYARLLKKSKRN